jgi:hypothetical protein
LRNRVAMPGHARFLDLVRNGCAFDRRVGYLQVVDQVNKRERSA